MKIEMLQDNPKKMKLMPAEERSNLFKKKRTLTFRELKLALLG